MARAKRSRSGAASRFASAACLTLLMAGCKDQAAGPGAPGAPSAGDYPDAVSVQGGSVVEGFASGVLLKSRSIGSLRMTRHPVTVAAYRRCFEAGACPEPAEGCGRKRGRNPLDRPTWPQGSDADAGTLTDSEQLPLTCPGTEAAQAFCAWLGGRLPTLPEWLLASRGSEPQRFPWGRDRPSCEQHPRSSLRPALLDAVPDGRKVTAQDLFCHDGSTEVFQVGRRPGAASPRGLEDVLLTRGELLGPDGDSSFGACAPPVRGCVVYGLEPAAIDALEPVADRGDEIGERTRTPYGFRCAWDDGRTLP